MGDTSIEWTDKVWNPVTGCSKVSEGCRNCYAERIAIRLWGDRKFTDVLMHLDRLKEIRKWKTPQRVFVNSMSDLFHEDVSDDFLNQVFSAMEATNHTFQILTKRPERMQKYLSWRWGGGRIPRRTIQIGISAEDQKTADERIPLLLKTPAAVRFVSAEPLLGPITFSRLHQYCPEHDFPGGFCTSYHDGIVFLDWVIVGGESGPGARPMHPDWARSLRDQCQAARVAYFFKQWGEWIGGKFDRRKSKMICQPTLDDIHAERVGRIFWTNPGEPKVHLWDEADHYWTNASARVGKKNAGRLLDGREWREFPNVR